MDGTETLMELKREGSTDLGEGRERLFFDRAEKEVEEGLASRREARAQRTNAS